MGEPRRATPAAIALAEHVQAARAELPKDQLFLIRERLTPAAPLVLADWIIDLGPEGGAGGGSILAAGTPEEVATHPKSYTAQYLRPLVGN